VPRSARLVPAFSLGLVLAAPLPVQAVAPPQPIDDDHGLSAPLAFVDRFSDVAGTLLRRSADPSLPAPNAPFSLDDPRFVVPVAGPGGTTGRCYNLDIRPAKPRRYYVFYDSIGNYRIGQFPVIDAVPGDRDYSAFWDVWKIVTPNNFRETNWVRDAATVLRLISDPSSGYLGRSTGVFLNAPVVPEGTTASMKGEGRPGHATQLYAWYERARAPFLYLEGSLRLGADGTVPVGTLVAADDMAAGLRAKSPFTASAWPTTPAYTPLTRVQRAGGPVLVNGFVNCPIVGTAAP
jgi:hypothetical protein